MIFILDALENLKETIHATLLANDSASILLALFVVLLTESLGVDGNIHIIISWNVPHVICSLVHNINFPQSGCNRYSVNRYTSHICFGTQRVSPIVYFDQVVSLPSRIDPHQTSAVVTLHGQLFVRVPFEQYD